MISDRITSRTVVELLAQRHAPPEWASFAELRCGTGTSVHADQSIDFFALNLWPSGRRAAVAYEVKVSRSDFLRELAQPRKRVFAESVANESWFAAPVGVAREEELPAGWGLLELKSDRTFRRVRAAPWREIQPFTPSFIASIARRSTGEKPELPPAAWRFEGRELSEVDLLELVKQRHADSRAARDLDLAQSGVEKWKLSDEFAQDLEFLQHVQSQIGCYATGADAIARFDEWRAAQRIGLELHQRGSVAWALRSILDNLAAIGIEPTPLEEHRRPKKP